VRRNGDILPRSVGDDTSNVIAVLEMFRALNRGAVQTKGDLVFLASVQEELGLLGAKHWLETSGYKPDMFIAVTLAPIRCGALRISHTVLLQLGRRPHNGEPWRSGRQAVGARAVSYSAATGGRGLDSFRPVANVGMIGGSTVVTPWLARRGSPWIALAPRSARDGVRSARAAETRRRLPHGKIRAAGLLKSEAEEERLNHPLVQPLAVSNHF
jgi:hypothetical protein